MATTQTVQNILDTVKIIPELGPVFGGPAGYSMEPGLTIANETFAYMFGTNFPWKFNEIVIAPFYSTSYQQDYAIPGLTNLGWLMSGDVVNINNTSLAKPRIPVEVVRDMPRSSSFGPQPSTYMPQKFYCCWLPNNVLYYGTWGAAQTGNATTGNNPVSGSVYTNPLSAGGAQPSNPITQIKDANGNFLVLTGYGHEGTTAPVAPANSVAGTNATPGSGATTVWTVVDPLGQGIRIYPVPVQSGVVWQFNLTAQAKPPALITSLNTLISPIPDDFSHIFRQGFISTAYRYSPEEKVRARYVEERRIWTESLNNAKMQADREPESYSFVPTQGVVAPVGGGYYTPATPFGGWDW